VIHPQACIFLQLCKCLRFLILLIKKCRYCGDTNFCFSNKNALFFAVNYLTDNFSGHFEVVQKQFDDMKICYLNMFKNSKKHNLNKFIIKGKMGLRILGESPCKSLFFKLI